MGELLGILANPNATRRTAQTESKQGADKKPLLVCTRMCRQRADRTHMKQRNNVRFFIRSLFALFRHLLKPQEKERFVRSFFYYFNRRRKRAYRELQKIPVLFFIFSSAGRSGGCSGVFVWWLFGGCSGGFSDGFIRLFFYVLL